ncbi:hypothetical protein RSAG8_02345, partial [Rhizoctonia solani AG-8 WAC10335]
MNVWTWVRSAFGRAGTHPGFQKSSSMDIFNPRARKVGEEVPFPIHYSPLWKSCIFHLVLVMAGVNS